MSSQLAAASQQDRDRLETREWIMNERAFSISHRIVRAVATITLVDFAMTALSPGYSHVTARGWPGVLLTFWSIGVSFLLPLYVGFEAWWMRKSKTAIRGLWVDGVLAITCFFSLAAIVLYAWGHYAMF